MGEFRDLLQGGDVTDFTERDRLVLAHVPMARAIARKARRQFPPSIETDDLTQEALVGLLRMAGRFAAGYRKAGYAKPVTFAAFAFRGVKGAMIDSNRRRHYTAATHLPLSKAGEAGAWPAEDARIDGERLAGRLKDAVGALPERERTLVERYYGHAVRMREIAVELGITERSARDVHKRALAALRAALERREAQPLPMAA